MGLNISEFPDGTIEIYDLHEEGGSLVKCLPNGIVELWEIPQYGGIERYVGEFKTIQEALNEGKSYT
jgi:hypothetical protein